MSSEIFCCCCLAIGAACGKTTTTTTTWPWPSVDSVRCVQHVACRLSSVPLLAWPGLAWLRLRHLTDERRDETSTNPPPMCNVHHNAHCGRSALDALSTLSIHERFADLPHSLPLSFSFPLSLALSFCLCLCACLVSACRLIERCQFAFAVATTTTTTTHKVRCATATTIAVSADGRQQQQ